MGNPVRQLDVVFIEPDSSRAAYQELSEDYSAIETPTWSLLLAASCRSKGYGVAILDCNAERLSDESAIDRVMDMNPRVACFVLYGQNPNSGTTSMIGGTRLCSALKSACPSIVTCFVGPHTAALPHEVASLEYVDIVLQNEGVYALHNLLGSDLGSDLSNVSGIGFKQDGRVVLTAPESIVPQDRMDIDLPGYAWDLLPYKNKPLDLYRAHFWHAGFDHGKRSPFAAIYSSLGCRFGCDFCMINIINRQDNSRGISSADSRVMRFWSPEFMVGQFEILQTMGVETVRIADEMFFLDKRYFEPLLSGIVDRGLQLRMWAYSRVDTVRSRYLELFRKAGVEWLALGVEAANQAIRQEVAKGTFKETNIREVISTVSASDIKVISNYIFGFPSDTFESMQETLDLALELNTEMANMYTCQALPGSPLHNTAKDLGWKLPETYSGYAFLSYDCQPLPTHHLTAAEVLRFRDEAWQAYFSRPEFLELIGNRFGALERGNVEAMASVKLKRALLGD
jgi:anaerobic magnesium-protoporphyrin IX monomethyl ester cyclase